MRRLLRHGLIAFTLFFAGPVPAAPMEDGQAAYNRGDYATAERLWRPLADEGNARAQNNLGVMYENGKGVPQDIGEALKWYRLAAEQGYAGAQNNLGMIYVLGRPGVPQDSVRAHMWLSLAASSLSGDIGKTVTGSRDVVAGMMSAQQVAQATELASRCQASNYKNCEPDRTIVASLAAARPASAPAVPITSHEVTLADYPAAALRLNEAGEVTVSYVINERGSVSICLVVLTSGKRYLDLAACAMVKKRWKYKPATIEGKPTTIQYISKIVFPAR